MALGEIVAKILAMGSKPAPAKPKPSNDKDDVRQAATLAVGIAGSVATAALAVLAVLGAIVTYVAANYVSLTVFYVLAGIAALLLIAAVYLGITGITQITNNGYEGAWSPWTEDQLFDKQALASLLGVLVLAASIVAGFTATPKPSPVTSTADSRQIARAVSETVVLERRLAATDRVLTQILRRLDVTARH